MSQTLTITRTWHLQVPHAQELNECYAMSRFFASNWVVWWCLMCSLLGQQWATLLTEVQAPRSLSEAEVKKSKCKRGSFRVVHGRTKEAHDWAMIEPCNTMQFPEFHSVNEFFVPTSPQWAKIMERAVTSWTLWTQLADSDSPDPKSCQVGLATGRSGLLTNDTLHDIVALAFA